MRRPYDAAKRAAELLADPLYVTRVYVFGIAKPVEECWGCPYQYAGDFALGVVSSHFEVEPDEVSFVESEAGNRFVIAGEPVAYYVVENARKPRSCLIGS